MGARDLRIEAHQAFQQKHAQLRGGSLNAIQERVLAIVNRSQTEAFAQATHLSPSRVEKIARGTQNAPENENKRALFMEQLVNFERHFVFTSES